MKISELIEGYFSRLDLERQRNPNAQLGMKFDTYKPRPKPAEEVSTEEGNHKFYLELWYDSVGYYIETVAPSIEKAKMNALFRVKAYIKSHYPKYDLTGLRRDQVTIDEIPPERIKRQGLRLQPV